MILVFEALALFDNAGINKLVTKGGWGTYVLYEKENE